MFNQSLASRRLFALLVSSILAVMISAVAAFAQTTAFTYQGRLTDSSIPANGNYDFGFKLFDTVTVGTGTQQGSTIQRLNISIANGSFTVQLDFGSCASCFNGADRFLEINVKPTSGSTYTTLAPRQQINSAPYALKSVNAATANGLSVACVNCVTSGQIASVNGSAVTGTIPVASLPAGSASYIQNMTSLQLSSNFNISGNGLIGGTLGIGTSTPSGLLHVRGASPVRILGETSTLSGSEFVDFFARSSIFASDLGGIRIQRQPATGNIDTLIFAAPSGSSATEAMRVSGNGNVGIGLTMPGFKLDVGDRMRVNNGASGSAGIWLHQFTGIGSVEQAFVGMQDNTHVGFFGNTGGGWSLTVNTTSGLVSAKGVSSISTSGTGVLGSSTSGVGVYGLSTNGNDGVVGEARVANRSGVYGFTTHAEGCGGCFENRAGGLALGVTGTARVSVLEITGGSDLAEHFEVSEQIKPGLVVAIDPRNAGRLSIARGAYNRRAAGVISGAKNLSPGMLLPNLSGARQSVPVALSGRVWVFCDASRNPIRPGDLLTTSHTPGHAMKVTNYAKAQGAIVGKAMSGLKSGRGLVLVLVTLQ